MEVGGQTAGIPFAEASVQVDDRLRALDVTKARTPGLKVLIGCLGEQAADVDVGLASLVLQGTIKRHNFKRGPVSHGSHNVRKPGSIGASATPSRVFKGQKMAGRMGGVRVTQPGLVIHQVDPERNLLLVKGSVPGPKSGLVEIREAK